MGNTEVEQPPFMGTLLNKLDADVLCAETRQYRLAEDEK
jgi:hypothetical protein